MYSLRSRQTHTKGNGPDNRTRTQQKTYPLSSKKTQTQTKNIKHFSVNKQQRPFKSKTNNNNTKKITSFSTLNTRNNKKSTVTSAKSNNYQQQQQQQYNYQQHQNQNQHNSTHNPLINIHVPLLTTNTRNTRNTRDQPLVKLSNKSKNLPSVNHSQNTLSSFSTSSSYQPQPNGNVVYQPQPIYNFPFSDVNEKPKLYTQHEVSNAQAPNLHLSEFGYSVNANDNIRRKSLSDAGNMYGFESVLRKLRNYYDSHCQQKSSSSINNSRTLKVLNSDYRRIEEQQKRSTNKSRIEHERDKSRNKLFHIMTGRKSHKKF